MTILNNPTANKSGLSEEPDGERLQTSDDRKGFTTEAALDRLEEDILLLLRQKEAPICNEKYVLHSTMFCLFFNAFF